MNLARTCLALAVMALLAGCAGKPVSLPQVTTPAAPQAVAIHADLNLTPGISGQSWSFKVFPGLKSGHVTFTLEGLDGQPVREKGQACVTYAIDGSTGTTKGSGGDCPVPAGNLAVQPPVAVGPQNAVDWKEDKMPPGTYSFAFTADPQVGRLVVDIAADY